jgi:hemolysin III
MSKTARYTRGEEIANSMTHGFGLLLSVFGMLVLIDRASATGDVWRLTSGIVFGLSLILLYASSAAYHGFRAEGLKTKLQIVDHAAIYVLIAGTYTPFMLVSLQGPWGWSVLAGVWSLAIAGIVFEILPGAPSKKVTVGLSVAMGWLIIVAGKPLLESVATGGLLLLLLGGLFYTGGIGFYLWRGLRHHHAIWHLFVLAGSAAHFFAILFYVMPVDSHG